MLTDLLLAIVHHLLVFALLAILVAEMMMVRPQMSAAAVLRAGRIDAVYGAIAGLILIVGFGRVFFGLKGADFYLTSHAFWTKIAAFAAIGLLSIPPTIQMIRWRNRARADQSFVPVVGEVQKVKRFMHMEAGVFILIPIFAAMMARGY